LDNALVRYDPNRSGWDLRNVKEGIKTKGLQLQSLFSMRRDDHGGIMGNWINNGVCCCDVCGSGCYVLEDNEGELMWRKNKVRN